MPSLSLGLATVAEVGGAALLAFLIFAIGDPRLGVPHAIAPAAVGCVVTTINFAFANLGVGLNPARDIGPLRDGGPARNIGPASSLGVLPCARRQRDASEDGPDSSTWGL